MSRVVRTARAGEGGTMDEAGIPGYRTGTWRADPAHSEVRFSVRHLAISSIRGVFRRFEATIVTTESPTDSTVEAEIEVASVETGHAGRDAHLRRGDLLAASEHPTIRFRSTAVDSIGPDFTVRGDLTLRGMTRPVVLRGEFGGIVVDGYGRTKAGASAATVVDRRDFGANWNAALEAGGFTLGDDVTIELDLEVVLDEAAAPGR